MRKLTALFVAMLFAAGNLSAQETGEGTQVVTFRFVAGNDMFYIPWAGNDAALERLCALLGEYRDAIANGTIPVRVDGYCASLPTAAENLRMAFVRANRVKSELITRKSLKESDFVTANYARACNGLKDVVVVTLRIPAGSATSADSGILSEAKNPEGLDKVNLRPQGTPSSDTSVILNETKDLKPRSAEHEMLHSIQHDSKGNVQQDKAADSPSEAVPPYRFALRTNLLYDALLLPTLGVEWRINRNVGIRLDGSLAHWGDEHGKVQKIWLLNPEVRYYLLASKRFYAGVSGSYGEYNIYKYPLGSLFSGDTGYQGKLWNAGLAVGYQLRLSRCFSADFSLGLGYTRSEYDSFMMIDKVRVIKDRNKSKNLWGPTQAGVSLVWTIGGNK